MMDGIVADRCLDTNFNSTKEVKERKSTKAHLNTKIGPISVPKGETLLLNHCVKVKNRFSTEHTIYRQSPSWPK
jgi:hypothetical protein